MTLLFWAIWASEQKSGGWIDVRDISWPPAVPNSKTTEDQFVHNAVPRLLLSYFQTRVEHNLNSKHTLTEDFFQISAARSQIWIQICLSDQMVDQFFFSCPSLIPREKRWESAAFTSVYDINSFERWNIDIFSCVRSKNSLRKVVALSWLTFPLRRRRSCR